MHTKNRIQFLIRFGYQGNRFHGVAPQPDVHTAGAALQERLIAATAQRPKRLSFTARTDAGVWAEMNYATCWFRPPLNVTQCIRDLMTPRDDGLLNLTVVEVPPRIHARTMSLSKHYRYQIIDNTGDELWTHERAWQISVPCSLEAMQAAAPKLVGTHDFSSFRGGKLTPQTPIRTIEEFSVRRQDIGSGQSMLTIDVVGVSFLRKMVRIIVGTLAEIGVGLYPPEHIDHVLAARDRQEAGVTAPARGLCLVSIDCEETFDWPALIPANTDIPLQGVG